MTDQTPPTNPLGHISPSLLQYVGRLGPGPRLVGWIGSGVRVSASLKKIPPVLPGLQPGECGRRLVTFA